MTLQMQGQTLLKQLPQNLINIGNNVQLGEYFQNNISVKYVNWWKKQLKYYCFKKHIVWTRVEQNKRRYNNNCCKIRCLKYVFCKSFVNFHILNIVF